MSQVSAVDDVTVLFSLLPSADDIQAWATSNKSAEYRLAELLLMLIANTARAAELHIPTGKAINQAGPDGIVVSPGENTWVPTGRSVWEWGVPHPDTKAESDYRDRTASTEPAERIASTFVFVTPWKWAKTRSWAEGKSALREWAAVKALDSSDLFGWLSTDFVTYLTLAEWISGPFAGEVRTLRSVWADWADRFWPPMKATPELLLAGRAKQAEQVRSWIGEAGYHFFRAESVDEGASFVAAALMTSEVHEGAMFQAAAVESSDSWSRLVSVDRQPMILVPMFPGPNIRPAVEDQGHTVLIPIEASRPSESEFTLPAADEQELVAALRGMNVSAERAVRIARSTRGSMVALQRELSELGAGRVWPAADLRLLATVGFVGRWDETRPGDLAVVGAVAGVDYLEVQAGLVELASEPAAPVRGDGAAWSASSQLGALREARLTIPRAKWEAFAATATEVLGARDPAWDLPADQRWMANVKDKARAHSDRLRAGLANATAIIATQPDFTELQGGLSGPDLAGRIVARLLRAANEDPSGERWADLSDQLPLLAEAAPNVFLDEVQHGLEGDDPILVKLLEDEPGVLVPRTRVTGLLWALERLAWSPDYLSAVVVILARLAAADQGGRSANRPQQSLSEILLPWHPQTKADADLRLEAIKAARRVAPTAVWPLMIRLLPQGVGDIGGVSSKPEWRRWAPVEESNRIPDDYWDVVRGVLELLLTDVGSDAERWTTLIDAYDDLPLELGDLVLAQLETVDPHALPADAMEMLSNALREEASRHRTYADAIWALPPERVAKLEELGRKFLPADPVRANAWLFAIHPSLDRVSGEDYHHYDEQLQRTRAHALGEIYRSRGWEGIEDLVARAEYPPSVGPSILELDDRAQSSALGWSRSEDKTRLNTLRTYVAARGIRDGWPWSEAFVRSLAATHAAQRVATLLLAASRGPEAWTLATDLGPDVDRAYWAEYDGFPEGEDQWIAVAKLIVVGRPFWALQIIGTNLTLKRGVFDAEAAYEALAASTEAEARPESREALNIDHEVAEIIKALDAAGFDRLKLANIEWVYLRILEHHEPGALKHIHWRLATDPSFFGEVVELVFRGAGQEIPAEPDPKLVRLAEQAYALLMSWHGPMPGASDDGSVDTAALNNWVDTARERLASSGRAEIGDQRIGHALWYSPAGADSLRPHEGVRDLFERIASQDVETGFSIEAFNSRGGAFRAHGGDQERDLAKTFDDIAQTMSSSWPRIAGVYRGLADNYRSIARDWDRRANDD